MEFLSNLTSLQAPPSWPLVAGCVALALAAAYLLGLHERLTYWRMPGTSGRPIIGDLPELARGSHLFLQACAQRYGRVFKVFWGCRPLVVVNDPAAARRVLLRNATRPAWIIENPLMLGRDRALLRDGLLLAEGAQWAGARKAWAPAFHTDSLARYAPLMTDGAAALSVRLAAAARKGAPIDICNELGRLTLAVVGTTAYGVDFDTLKPDDDDEGGVGSAASNAAVAATTNNNNNNNNSNKGDARGSALVAACAEVFAQFELHNASKWLIAAMCAPTALRPLVAYAANALPDAAFKRGRDAQRTLHALCLKLVDDWRAASPASNDGVKAGPLSTGIAPGSFLGALLRTRGDGHALSYDEVASQSNTFTLAGFDTTSNALSGAVFGVASNAAAEAALLAELDALGKPGGAGLDLNDLQRLPYTAAVIDEALRLWPPGAAAGRVLAEPTSLGGYELPAGASVLVDIWTMHRDPAWWPRADEFLPERWLPGHDDLACSDLKAYMPFGDGARRCVGMKFALQEARLALAALYCRFRFELAPWQAGRPLATVNGLTLSAADGVWVTPVPRASAGAAAA